MRKWQRHQRSITIVIDVKCHHRLHIFEGLTSYMNRKHACVLMGPRSGSPILPSSLRGPTNSDFPQVRAYVPEQSDHREHVKRDDWNYVQIWAKHWFTPTRRGKDTSAVLHWDGVGIGPSWKVTFHFAEVRTGESLRCRESVTFVLWPRLGQGHGQGWWANWWRRHHGRGG